MKVIIIEKKQKQNKAEILISVEGERVKVNANDVEYKDLLKALEGLTYATTKAGINECEHALDIYNVLEDTKQSFVDGRDSVFEERC